MNRWRIRKIGNMATPTWVVHDPDGSWSATFTTWSEAIRWATSFASRVEHWLEHQP